MSTNVVDFNNDEFKFPSARDNYFKDCPALMSDGRFITSWIPNCEMNANIEKLFGKKKLNSWEYTYDLTNESKKVFNYIDNNYKKNYSCSEYYNIPGPLLVQDCNIDNCVINNTGDKTGIGLK